MSDLPDRIREAFSGKQGKVLLVGGGLAVAAYVWYVRTHPSEPDVATEDDLTGGNTDGVRTPQDAPSSGNTTTGDTGTKRPENNGEWLSDAVDFLVGRGVSGGAAYTALSKALAGQQVTTQEAAWVSQAITGIGVPPEGMPPLQTAPPTSGGGGTTTPPPVTKPPTTTKPPTKPAPTPQYYMVRVTRFTTASAARGSNWPSTISTIAQHYHKSTSAVWNDSRNAGLRSRRKAPDKIQPGDTVYVKK